MKDFWFRRMKEPPLSEGTIHLAGMLLEQLKALGPGQVLKLTGEDGKSYAIVNWDDLGKRPSSEQQKGDSNA